MRRFFPCLILILLFAGCDLPAANAPSEHAETAMESGLVSVTGYALDPDGFLAPATRRLPAGAQQLERTLALLTDTPENRTALSGLGLMPVLPEGTAFRLSRGSGGELHLDVSQLPELDSRDAEWAAVAAIVNTACSGGERSVQLTFDGEASASLPHGTAVSGALAPFLLNPEPLPVVAEGVMLYPATLFYPNAARTAILPVTRHLTNEPKLPAAIGALIRNPADSSLPACYPPGLLLEYARLTEGVATLSFSEAFYRLADDPKRLDQAVKCILLTAAQFDAVKQVKLEVAGEAFGLEHYALPASVNALP